MLNPDGLFVYVPKGNVKQPPTWKHKDVFPIIERIIQEAYRELQRFVTVREIADRLLEDPKGGNFIKIAAGKQRVGESEVASNMVAWFTVHFDEGKSVRGRVFEQTTIGDLVAYKPKPIAATAPASR